VIVLTDGRNDDADPSDDRDQFEELLSTLRSNAEGETARPVRVFTLAYGQEADAGDLRRIAEASNATAYRASDATTIDQVFEAVVSNF
ncbi:MAG TPA: VWA domain-containing protein, partial [Microthrixaceae bacterium]|nr:VWA domain-containing protein [Microthrixaceae bacterium]